MVCPTHPKGSFCPIRICIQNRSIRNLCPVSIDFYPRLFNPDCLFQKTDIFFSEIPEYEIRQNKIRPWRTRLYLHGFIYAPGQFSFSGYLSSEKHLHHYQCLSDFFYIQVLKRLLPPNRQTSSGWTLSILFEFDSSKAKKEPGYTTRSYRETIHDEVAWLLDLQLSLPPIRTRLPTIVCTKNNNIFQT